MPGDTTRRVTQEKRLELIELFASNPEVTVTEVVGLTGGMSVPTGSKILKMAGFDIRPGRELSADKERELQGYLRKGYLPDDAARFVRVSGPTARRRQMEGLTERKYLDQARAMLHSGPKHS